MLDRDEIFFRGALLNLPGQVLMSRGTLQEDASGLTGWCVTCGRESAVARRL